MELGFVENPPPARPAAAHVKRPAPSRHRGSNRPLRAAGAGRGDACSSPSTISATRLSGSLTRSSNVAGRSNGGTLGIGCIIHRRTRTVRRVRPERGAKTRVEGPHRRCRCGPAGKAPEFGLSPRICDHAVADSATSGGGGMRFPRYHRPPCPITSCSSPARGRTSSRWRRSCARSTPAAPSASPSSTPASTMTKPCRAASSGCSAFPSPT